MTVFFGVVVVVVVVVCCCCSLFVDGVAAALVACS
jgi:hypothetical protein